MFLISCSKGEFCYWGCLEMVGVLGVSLKMMMLFIVIDRSTSVTMMVKTREMHYHFCIPSCSLDESTNFSFDKPREQALPPSMT